jgi:uncharacterized protein
MQERAASILREARRRARITQAELAERAGVTQGVVSIYESAQREPSLGTLQNLVAAAGYDIAIALVPVAERSPLRVQVDQNRARLARALRALGGRNVRLFGSVAVGTDRLDSDIDLLVDVLPSAGLFALGRMRSEAERILGTSVDIVPSNSLKPDVAERVLAEAILL